MDAVVEALTSKVPAVLDVLATGPDPARYSVISVRLDTLCHQLESCGRQHITLGVCREHGVFLLPPAALMP